MLDHIDRSAKNEPSIYRDCLRQAARIATLVAQTETEFEVLGHPRALPCQLSKPDAQISSELADFVTPDAFDGRGKFLFVLFRHLIERPVEQSRRLCDAIDRDRQLTLAVHRAQ